MSRASVAALLLSALLVTSAAAQTERPRGITISGTVRDSLVHRPLAGATVQIASRDIAAPFTRAVRTDSLGRYAIPDVPAGRFTLGFLHPRLDSIGVEAARVEVRSNGRRDVRVNLASPSAAELRAMVCGLGDDAGGALLIGAVRAANGGAPVEGATVVGEWLEFTLRPSGALERNNPRVVATTGENGVFSMCDVPAGGSVFLTASDGRDTTDFIEVPGSSIGVIRRDLYLGGTSNIALRGTVRTVDGARPLSGALVRLKDGPQARTNERGEWMIAEAPSGTRNLEVRSIGYYPVQRSVDVIPGASPVALELSTFAAVLDTVRVTAQRMTDRSQGGFDQRKRGGMGRFLDEEEIKRRRPIFTSDLFRMVPGVRLDGFGFERRLLVRGDIAAYCAPTIYLDGLMMFDLSADELDAIISPSRIRGIEIYTGMFTPVEFQRSFGGCGAIVIWTK